METKIFKFHHSKIESLEAKLNRFFKEIDPVDVLTIKQVVIGEFIITTVFYIHTV